MSTAVLSPDQLAQLRAVATALIPGRDPSPAAADLPELDQLLQQAAAALGSEFDALAEAVQALPPQLDWATLEAFETADPGAFELVSTVAAGAYFMSKTVLDSLGYPTGPRSAAPFDLAADELASGILEPVIARGSLLRTTSDQAVTPPPTGDKADLPTDAWAKEPLGPLKGEANARD